MEKIGFFATEIPKHLTFLKHKVSFPDQFFYYGAAFAAFAPQIEECIAEMRDDFGNYIADFDDFVKNGPLWIKNKMRPLVQFAVDQLSLNGCFDVTFDRFWETYLDDEFNYCEQLREQMLGMQADFDAEMERRNAERVARRKLNEAEGSNWLLERARNGAEWAWDQGKIQSQKDDFYNSSAKERIKEEFAENARCMLDFFLDALFETTGQDLRVFSDDDLNRAFAMFKNLEDGKIPESRQADVAFEILNIYPFVPGLLDWAVVKYGDAEGELQKLADALNYYIDDTKEELLKTVWDNADFSTEELALTAKAALEKEEARLSFQQAEYHEHIDKILHDFDVKARTVKKITYKSREEAQKARELYRLFEKLPWDTEPNALESQKKIQEISQKLNFSVQKIDEAIQEKLNEFDRLARTVGETEYKTRELAQKAQRLIELYNSFSLKGEAKILGAKEKFLALEKELEFSLPEYEAKIDALLQDIDLKARVFDGVEYKSREEAADAKKQYNKIKQLVKTYTLEELNQVNDLISAIQNENFTIPTAEQVLDRLDSRKKVLSLLPIKHIGIYRMICSLPVGIGACVFTAFMSSTFGDPFWQTLFMISLIAFIVVRKKFLLKYAQKFEKSKDYKNAALFYELAKPLVVENYLGLK